MTNELGRLVAAAADERAAARIERRRTCQHLVTRTESEGLVCNRCDQIVSPR
jgi:hypothetical protein